MVELSRLLPLESKSKMKSELRWEIKFLKPVMFLLRLGVDKVGHDEWRNNNKERLSNSPQDVGKSFKIKKNKINIFENLSN